VIEALVERVNRDAVSLGLGRAHIEGAVLLGRDRNPSAKVAFVLFDRDGRPRAVAKVPRDDVGEAAILGEFAALRSMWWSGPEIVVATAPRPMFLDRVADRLVLLMSAVDGTPLTTRYYAPGHVRRARNVATDFRLAAAWLDRFQSETRVGEAVLDDDSAGVWIDAVFRSYRERLGWGDAEEGLLASVKHRARELYGCRIPIVAEHGDYAIGNILIGADDTVSGVVDWECGSPAATPFRDVYKFPTSYGLYLDRALGSSHGGMGSLATLERPIAAWRVYGEWRHVAGFARTYFATGWFPAEVRAFILGRLERLGIPAAMNAVFFPIFLAEQAMALPDPAFRSGYRALLRAFADREAASWLSRVEVAA
jgi:hypothetical protein